MLCGKAVLISVATVWQAKLKLRQIMKEIKRERKRGNPRERDRDTGTYFLVRRGLGMNGKLLWGSEDGPGAASLINFHSHAFKTQKNPISNIKMHSILDTKDYLLYDILHYHASEGLQPPSLPALACLRDG